MTSLQYFGHILVKILPNTNKIDIYRIYIERAVEKCPRWKFQTHWKPRNSKNKSAYSFARHGHPVLHLLQFSFIAPLQGGRNFLLNFELMIFEIWGHTPAAGSQISPPAPRRIQFISQVLPGGPIMPPQGPKMAHRAWKGVYPQVQTFYFNLIKERMYLSYQYQKELCPPE